MDHKKLDDFLNGFVKEKSRELQAFIEGAVPLEPLPKKTRKKHVFKADVTNRKIPVGSKDEIIEMYKNGAVLESIAKKFGVTRERIRQVLVSMGISYKDGGTHVRAEKNRQAIRERREKNVFNSWGLTLEEYKQHIAKYGTSAIMTSPMHLFMHHRRNVKRHHGANMFAFTFAEWWKAWTDSGHWEERGQGGYCMKFQDHAKPLGPDNYEIYCIKGAGRPEYRVRKKANWDIPIHERFNLTEEEYRSIKKEYSERPFESFKAARSRVQISEGDESWKLTFRDWWNAWQATGVYGPDGVKDRAYGLRRKDPTKPYVPENIIVCDMILYMQLYGKK